MSEWWERVRALEPARVRSVWIAIVALAVALGVTVNTDLDAAVQAIIVAVFGLLPLIQGEATRAKVYPEARVEQIIEDLDFEEFPEAPLDGVEDVME